jgi:hypothetical protein
MGVFREWQPRYLEQGIATFPVKMPDKRPLVPWAKIGTKLSSELATKSKFVDCDGIAFRVDQLHGGPKITVLDIDIADQRQVDRAIERHGDTEIIVRTASGKFHLYYRHNGEPRLVRAWGNDVPIDLLGSGMVIAAPSIGEGGSYQFIKGDLSQIRNLPPMRGIDELLGKIENPKPLLTGERIREGNRNSILWRECMRFAKTAQSVYDVIAFAKEYNEAHMEPPLMEMEVIEIAKSAWRNEERGTNYFGSSMVICQPAIIHELVKESPDALALLMEARSLHWEKERFYLANAMAESLGWNEKRFTRARRKLVERGYVWQLVPANRHRPAEYGWPRVRGPDRKRA